MFKGYIDIFINDRKISEICNSSTVTYFKKKSDVNVMSIKSWREMRIKFSFEQGTCLQ